MFNKKYVKLDQQTRTNRIYSSLLTYNEFDTYSKIFMNSLMCLSLKRNSISAGIHWINYDDANLHKVSIQHTNLLGITKYFVNIEFLSSILEYLSFHIDSEVVHVEQCNILLLKTKLNIDFLVSMSFTPLTTRYFMLTVTIRLNL